MRSSTALTSCSERIFHPVSQCFNIRRVQIIQVQRGFCGMCSFSILQDLHGFRTCSLLNRKLIEHQCNIERLIHQDAETSQTDTGKPFRQSVVPVVKVRVFHALSGWFSGHAELFASPTISRRRASCPSSGHYAASETIHRSPPLARPGAWRPGRSVPARCTAPAFRCRYSGVRHGMQRRRSNRFRQTGREQSRRGAE